MHKKPFKISFTSEPEKSSRFILSAHSHFEKDEKAKASYLPDKYFLSQDSIFLALRASNLPGMVQFEDQDCSHSTQKYGLNKVLHMLQHTDIELPLPSAKEKNSDL